MRVLAIDVGRARTGVAISDASGTLARPLTVVRGADVLEPLVTLVVGLRDAEDGLATIVMGLPRLADGGDLPLTEHIRRIAAALEARTGLPVVLLDERLTSYQAESLLAELEPDWRERKTKLDAAAAAVILQEYLDRPRQRAPSPAGREHAR
jgi:putative Holliday junction resolvase